MGIKIIGIIINYYSKIGVTWYRTVKNMMIDNHGSRQHVHRISLLYDSNACISISTIRKDQRVAVNNWWLSSHDRLSSWSKCNPFEDKNEIEAFIFCSIALTTLPMDEALAISFCCYIQLAYHGTSYSILHCTMAVYQWDLKVNKLRKFIFDDHHRLLPKSHITISHS